MNWTSTADEEAGGSLSELVCGARPGTGGYVLKKATGKSLTEGLIPPEALMDVWKGSPSVATSEAVP